jgi:hypothetical protein
MATQQIDLDELEAMGWDLPGIVYKYRNWDDPNHKKMLMDQELWLASPSDFNDPFDGKLHVAYEKLNPADLYAVLYERSGQLMPRATHQERTQATQVAFSRMSDEKQRSEIMKGMTEARARFFGVISLSPKIDNLLLWAHYANSHKGFAIGFDTKSLWGDVGGTISRVIYQKKYPAIVPKLQGRDSVEELMEIMNTKSKHWKYEREIRICKTNGARVAVPFQASTLREVVLGCNMPPAQKQEVFELVSSKYPHASVYEALIKAGEFKLEMNKLR